MILRINIGAFVLSPELKQTVEGLSEDRLFLRSTINAHEGGVQGAVTYLAEHSTPELVIVETTAQDDDLYEELGALADVCSAGTRVIVVGSENDINMFKSLIDQGVSQYFVGTPDAEDLKQAIVDAFADKSMNAKCRTIAVTGLRGGVGSSVIAHNIGFELANLYDEDVIIIDLDITFGTGALSFNIQPQHHLADTLAQGQNLDEVILMRYLENCGKNVSLLAAPGTLTTGVEITEAPLEHVLGLVRQMASYVILDVPHAWSSWVQDVLIDADETILVATPDLYNLRDGKNLVEFLSPNRGPEHPTRLVFNKSGENKKGELAPKEFREVLAMAPDIIIPFEPDAFAVAMNNGEMLSQLGRSKAADSIKQLAALVSGKEDKTETADKTKKSGFLGGLLKK